MTIRQTLLYDRQTLGDEDLSCGRKHGVRALKHVRETRQTDTTYKKYRQAATTQQANTTHTQTRDTDRVTPTTDRHNTTRCDTDRHTMLQTDTTLCSRQTPYDATDTYHMMRQTDTTRKRHTRPKQNDRRSKIAQLSTH